MQTKNTILDFTDQAIFIGLDVHKNSWKCTLCTDHLILRTVSITAPFPDNLVTYLNKHFPGANYSCAYEAGFCGFWVHEQLEARGIKTLVVHDSDIPTSDKERQFRDDVRDSRKITVSLRNGYLQSIYVPSKAAAAQQGLAV